MSDRILDAHGLVDGRPGLRRRTSLKGWGVATGSAACGCLPAGVGAQASPTATVTTRGVCPDVLFLNDTSPMATLDPPTAAALDLDQVHSRVDDLLAAHGGWLPPPRGSTDGPGTCEPETLANGPVAPRFAPGRRGAQGTEGSG